jgi:hypothetical protein
MKAIIGKEAVVMPTDNCGLVTDAEQVGIRVEFNTWFGLWGFAVNTWRAKVIRHENQVVCASLSLVAKSVEHDRHRFSCISSGMPNCWEGGREEEEEEEEENGHRPHSTEWCSPEATKTVEQKRESDTLEECNCGSRGSRRQNKVRIRCAVL